MTYEQFAVLLALTLGAVGMYLMAAEHTFKGMWVRSSIGRLARRTLRRLRGQNVVLASGLPSNVHNYRLDDSTRQKRVFIYPER